MSDLISRQAALDAVTRYCTRYDLREVLADIEAIPTVIEREKGRWVARDERWHCSMCDAVAPKGYRYNYCPNCGAKMDSGKAKEENL